MFYNDMQKLQTYLYVEVKKHDEDKRKEREKIKKVTPEVSLRQLKLRIPKSVLKS